MKQIRKKWMTALINQVPSSATKNWPLLEGLKGFLPSILHNFDHLVERAVDLLKFCLQADLKIAVSSRGQRLQEWIKTIIFWLIEFKSAAFTSKPSTDDLASATWFSLILSLSCKSALIRSCFALNENTNYKLHIKMCYKSKSAFMWHWNNQEKQVKWENSQQCRSSTNVEHVEVRRLIFRMWWITFLQPR